MPQTTTINVPKWTWVQLTDANVTNITFRNEGGSTMLVEATVGAVAPSDIIGARAYPPGAGEVNVALASLFPGTTGANRVYAWGRDDTTSATVSNA